MNITSNEIYVYEHNEIIDFNFRVILEFPLIQQNHMIQKYELVIELCQWKNI